MTSKEVKELNAVIGSKEFKNQMFSGFFKNDVQNPLMEYQHKPLFMLSCILFFLCWIVLIIYTFAIYAYTPINECRFANLILLAIFLTTNMKFTNRIIYIESNNDILGSYKSSETFRVYIACSMFCNFIASLYILLLIWLGDISYYVYVTLSAIIVYFYFVICMFILSNIKLNITLILEYLTIILTTINILYLSLKK